MQTEAAAQQFLSPQKKFHKMWNCPGLGVKLQKGMKIAKMDENYKIYLKEMGISMQGNIIFAKDFWGYFEKDAVADTIIAKQLKVYFALHSLESWENV